MFENSVRKYKIKIPQLFSTIQISTSAVMQQTTSAQQGGRAGTRSAHICASVEMVTHSMLTVSHATVSRIFIHFLFLILEVTNTSRRC